jgi:hypothetical protein
MKIRLVHLAAAVPVDFVQHGGRLRPAVDMTSATAVFYSRADKVLARDFRIGSSFSWTDDGVWWPEAVGLNGLPLDDLWAERNPQRGFAHSDCWRSATLVSEIARWLGSSAPLPIAARGEIPKRELPRRQDPPARRIDPQLSV